MNFFEQQHRARRRTWLMLLLFVLAVAAIVAAFDLVCAVVYILLFDPQILYSSRLIAAGSPLRLRVVHPRHAARHRLGNRLAAVPALRRRCRGRRPDRRRAT